MLTVFDACLHIADFQLGRGFSLLTLKLQNASQTKLTVFIVYTDADV